MANGHRQRRPLSFWLTLRSPKRPWSPCARLWNLAPKTRLSGLLSLLGQRSRVLGARDNREIIGTLRLATKKPWAIDQSYFKTVSRPLYLRDMAVSPDLQCRGIGRQLVEEAKTAAQAWPREAIRLDAYDNDAGAGAFYAKCWFLEVGRKTYRGVPLVYFELML